MCRKMNLYTRKHTKIKMQKCSRMLGTVASLFPESQYHTR